MGDLSGKVAFITGAGDGIGRASASLIAAAGASVMLVDVDAAGVAETARRIREKGGDADHVIADISDADAVQKAVDATVARFGRLDLAHNNAAILGAIAPLAAYPHDVARRVFDVNVMGLLYCLQSQINHMIDHGGGSIVNTASVSGIRATPEIGVYTASKHAAIGLTKAAALEYSKHGIRINCLCPGFVDTKMNGNYTPEVLEEIGARHPIGRVSQPHEVAEAALWMLTDKASFVTGAMLMIDGGLTTT